MSEFNQIAKEFLSQKGKEVQSAKRSLTPHNSFRALFEMKEIPEEEIRRMQVLFGEHLKGNEDEESVRSDFRELVQLTSELKAIQKQAILLIGERVFRVREIFMKYGEERGGFTAWLNVAFNSKKTAYNALAFYDLYTKLPSESLKENFKKMPAKAGYILASRRGESEIKYQIIEHYKGEKQKEVIEIIEEKLPLQKGDLRSKDLAEKTLDEMERLIDVLDRRVALVRKRDGARIEKMILRLRAFIDTFS